MTKYLLVVEPHGGLGNENALPSGAEVIFRSAEGYFRTREFDFHAQGQIGFPPKGFLRGSSKGRELVLACLGIDVLHEPSLETVLYKNLSSQELTTSSFSSSADKYVIDVDDTATFQVVRSYSIHGKQAHGPTSFHKYFTLEEAVSYYKIVSADPQAQLIEDYTHEKMLYDEVKEHRSKLLAKKERLYSHLSLETGNGQLVLGEEMFLIPDPVVSGLEIISRFELINLDPVEKRVRASQKRIPKLDYECNQISNDAGTLLEYGSNSLMGGKDFSFTFNALEDLTRKITETADKLAVLMVLYEGMDDDDFLHSVGVSAILGYTPLADLSRPAINEQYKTLVKEHARGVAERQRKVVGVGLYDLLNKVVHRKLDGDFTKNAAQKGGVFYPHRDEKPFGLL